MGLPGPGCTSSHQPWYAPQKRTRFFFFVWYRARRTACITASVPLMWKDTWSWPEMAFKRAMLLATTGW